MQAYFEDPGSKVFMKLFLYSSYLLSTEHRDALHRLVGKAPKDITFAAIENATDVEQDARDWISDSRNSIAIQDAQVEVIDLRQWRDNRTGLRAKLVSKDVIWVCGGNGFYLRWILKETGADEIIRDLVHNGTVYAGWSAGAIIAGPTLRYFDSIEDLTVTPEVFFDALNLTNIVVVPHIDVEEFAEGMKQINQQLRQAGFRTVPLMEAQALVAQENEQQVI
jgi:dipeptidase E